VVTSPGIIVHVYLTVTDVLEYLKKNIMVHQIEGDTHVVENEGSEAVVAYWKNRREHSSTKQQYPAKPRGAAEPVNHAVQASLRADTPCECEHTCMQRYEGYVELLKQLRSNIAGNSRSFLILWPYLQAFWVISKMI
jgi:hypothetical protein